MRIIPYINLAGSADQAMNFYKDIFGGKSEKNRWSEMPPNPKMPVSEAWQKKVMRGSLSISEGVTVYLSDSLEEGTDTFGNNVFLHVEFDSEEELRKAFEALSAGGTVNMPVDSTFWGAVYGDLVDKYGIGWGLHFQLPQ